MSSIFHNRNLTLRLRINLETLGFLASLTMYPSLPVHRMDNLCMKIALQLETLLTIARMELQEVQRLTGITERFSSLKLVRTLRTRIILTQ